MTSKVLRPVRKTKLAALSIILLGAIGSFTACADHEAKPRLDVAATSSAQQDEDSWLREQRTLRVKYWADATPDQVTERELSGSELIYGIDDSSCNKSYVDSCSSAIGNIDYYLCLGRLYMAVATIQSDPLVIPTMSPAGHMVVDRVTEANAADAAIYAGEYARVALNKAFYGLTVTPNECKGVGATVWQNFSGSGRSAPVEYAARVTEAYWLAMAATERSVEATINVSDQARSSSLSPSKSRQRSILGAQYSRAAAAHMLVGGDDGLLGSTDTGGYCLGGPLAPKTRAALQLIRDAAPSPSLLTGDINTLVNGTTSASTPPGLNGSVRERLGAFYNNLDLKAGKGVDANYDLTIEDFTKARDYLVQELTTFNRSASAYASFQQPDTTGFYRYAGTGGDRVSALPVGSWAARARHYTTHSRWYTDAGYWNLTEYDNSLPGYYLADAYFRPTPEENLIAGTHMRIRDLFKSTDGFSHTVATGSTAESAEVKGVLASILTSKDYKGMLELYASTSLVRPIAYGYSAADKVRVVVGEDGLRCAVEGTIEGVACNDALTGANYNYPATAMPTACQTKPATLGCLTIHTSTRQGAGGYYGTDVSTYGQASPLPYNSNGSRNVNTSDLIANKTRLYFVKLKNPTDAEAPGNFELIGGQTLLLNNWSIAPVIPSLAERVDEVLAPNRKNCAVPTTTCIGKDFDARLPLEDELSNDGDNVENSWKHYLDLAKQAAAESDSLGKEFQQSKLNQLQGTALAAQRKEEKAQAAEAALENVQQICGTAIDNKALLAYFSGANDGNNSKLDTLAYVPPSACPATPCAANSVCISGMCVKDPAKLTDPSSPLANDPDAKKLADCLSGASSSSTASSLERFVTLGDKALCVYTKDTAPASPPCPTADPTNPSSASTMPAGTVCPDVAVKTTLNTDGTATTGASGSCPSTPPGMTAYLAKPLGYFSYSMPAAGQATCADFRRARKNHTRDLVDPTATDSTIAKKTPLGLLRDSPMFAYGRFSDTVGRLGFVAKYGGVWDITEDGATRWSSGNVAQGRNLTGWPGVVPPTCSGGETGLFCTAWPPTQPAPPAAPVPPTFAEVTDMNARAFWAVVAAGAIRGWMDSSKAEIDLTYPVPATAHSGTTTTTTIYQGGTNPVRETRSKNDNVTKLSYQWMNGTDPNLAWWSPSPNPGGFVYNSGALNFVGPYPATALINGWQYMSQSATEAMFLILSGYYAADERVLIQGQEAFPVVDGTYHKLPPGFDQSLFSNDSVNGYTRAFLDGWEMLCELDRAHLGGSSTPASLLLNTSDLEQTGNYLRSLADRMEMQAGMLVLPNVPKTAIAALSSAPQSGDLPQLGGDMGQAVSDMRNGFVQVRQMTPIIASQLKQMSAGVESLRAQLDNLEATKEINELEKWSQALNNANACAQTASWSRAVDSFGISQGAACSNAIAQTAIAFRKESLQDRIANNDATIAKATFAEKMAQHAETLQVASLGLETAIENTKAAQNRIESNRKKAALALSKAIYLASYQSADQVRYDLAVGALSDIAQRRYTTALKNAKLMAFLARRAIEQRLGVNLVDMREDLALVDAPASWEGDACSMNGIQPDDAYGKGDATANGNWTAIYGQSFIGEYVNKLENVIESYRLQHPFHEGQDVAVISLRDDVLDTRTECMLQSRNMLKYSADPSNVASWGVRGCTSQTINGKVETAFNCIQAVPQPDFVPTRVPATTEKVPDLAVKGLRGGSKGAQGYFLRFGDGLNTCTAGSNCGWASGAAVSQVFDLGPGKYRLSWYTRDLTTATFMNAAKSGIVVARKFGTTTTNPTTANFVAPAVDGEAGEGWKRASIEITVTALGSYEIGFGVTQAVMPTPSQLVTVGGPMLERLVPTAVTTMLPSFQATDGDGKFSSQDCEDKLGLRFKSQHWTRQCTHLCSDGFSGACITGPQYCYREFSFGVAQPWIATGKLFKYSGFARGNYNYRIDSVALNFVGSGARDCTDSPTPSTCYNAGFIPYTLQHTGPFYTRNYAGDDVESLLFDASIEHARGLALERYITNPISSTDRELLSDYTRREFAGRPLDGNFTVRMWEEPGVNLDAIEDVQLVLNYRYWTANE